MKNSKAWFKNNQNIILSHINTEVGRCITGLEKEERIIKITPNSIHILKDFINNKAVVEARFYTSEYFTNLLRPIYEKIKIADEYQKILDISKAFAHYSGLQNHRDFPTIFLSTLTVNPATGDGQSAHANGTFSTSRSAATGTYYAGRGTFNGYNNQHFECTFFGGVYYLARGFLPTDTSSLTSDAVISAATYLINISTFNSNADSQTLGLIGTTQAATNTISDTDYDNITLNSPTEFATRLTISSTGDKTWTLNSSGLNFISKTGFSLFGFRSSGDIDNSAFANNNNFNVAYAGSANPPTLTITYTLPAGGFFHMSV